MAIAFWARTRQNSAGSRRFLLKESVKISRDTSQRMARTTIGVEPFDTGYGGGFQVQIDSAGALASSWRRMGGWWYDEQSLRFGQITVGRAAIFSAGHRWNWEADSITGPRD